MTRFKGMSRNNLAYMYFNRDWHPMHFETMANWLSGAKPSFACSAHLADHTEGINLTGEQSNFLKTIPGIITSRKRLGLHRQSTVPGGLLGEG